MSYEPAPTTAIIKQLYNRYEQPLLEICTGAFIAILLVAYFL